MNQPETVSPSKPIVLTIAGSDSGGGAGIQADLKTFQAFGVFGTSALTLITAQNTLGVQQVYPLPPEMIAAQIEAVLSDLPPQAIKIGALGQADIIGAVAEALRGVDVPVILDPVMVAKGGASLLDPAATKALIHGLLPLATLVTPNLPEAEALGTALDGKNVLLKGGHAAGETVMDCLRWQGQASLLTAPRQYTRHTHGTGCTLSAAIAAGLALGLELPQAVADAHAYVARAIAAAPGLGRGHGPLEHAVRPERIGIDSAAER
ncbi:hydroxymethylpyrimidine/phosphomethylpyrimidine kinase family protein [Deinococcus radiophilus]|uniref:hydroxymethylpyrimidine kinase n=1 Tax=Deinococcus radiophilus TaxID=32062 RepID=A0A3S0KFE4_9DEIO|nr:bifunctional hydroxymethylpyrimidine kinase/phosphomethylpyrimidine kinase [Deinococcus radiophilus]RTR25501.1 hydroxymethylpyrimidine/phosphomethylpyrimidine kinase [Deinococcus radiophilus]UFA51733.1 hydroxymethylpyrimidine/phosphomethylpyrimidine kinase [Deinococcus radiophilus]